MRDQRILILGASSWLGFLCARKLSQLRVTNIIGTARSRSISLPGDVELVEAASLGDYESVFESHGASVVINFLRGEEEKDFVLHQMATDYCASQSAIYVYASSVLALDGYENQELLESLPAKSISPYGTFKARCESHLVGSGIEHLIVRFASVQGWVEHKRTRNELFLRRISSGESVTVDTGVLQNRLYADDLAEMLVALIELQASGVVHLGTVDSSSEVDFLRREAQAFGWDPQLVVEGEYRDVNLVAKPDRALQLLGDTFRRKESDTIASLLSCEGLANYVNSSSENVGKVRK